MIGISGYWYRFKKRQDKDVDYEFFQYNERLQDGVCSEDEMCIRFYEMINKKFM